SVRTRLQRRLACHLPPRGQLRPAFLRAGHWRSKLDGFSRALHRWTEDHQRCRRLAEGPPELRKIQMSQLGTEDLSHRHRRPVLSWGKAADRRADRDARLRNALSPAMV